jgi:chromosome segregation ATPase
MFFHLLSAGNILSIPILWRWWRKFTRSAIIARSSSCLHLDTIALQSAAAGSCSVKLEAQVLQLQQQLEQASHQLFLAKQRASDCDAFSDALRKDVARLQDQLQQCNANANSAADRAAAAAAAAAASDAAAAQLRCDAQVAQAREDALAQRAEAAAQRVKSCEKEIKVLSDKNALMLREIEILNAAKEQQNHLTNESSRRHQERIAQLEQQIDAERSRSSKLAGVVSAVTASSSTDLDHLKLELASARSSAISNQDIILQLQAAALVRDQKMRDAEDSQSQLKKQVIAELRDVSSNSQHSSRSCSGRSVTAGCRRRCR